jgi:HlyB family type I secretion system ABC transporter
LPENHAVDEAMEVKDIRQLLDRHPLFESLSSATIDRMAATISVDSFQLGEIIVRSGDIDRAFYLVVNGKARMVDDTDGAKPITLEILGAGDYFCEQAVFGDSVSTFTVRASADLTLLRFAVADIDRASAQALYFHKELAKKGQERAEFQFFRCLTVFSDLTLLESQQLFSSLKTIYIQPHEWLLTAGEITQSAYMIRSGSLQLVKEQQHLATLRPGDLCGEIALLDIDRQPAGAIAVTESVVWCLDGKLFGEMIHNSKVDEQIAKLLKNRALQQQAIISDSQNLPGQDRNVAPPATIEFRERRLNKTNYRYAQTTTPSLAGSACLATIDRFYGRAHDLSSIVAQQTQSDPPDNLFTISRKAEAWGYLTRLLQLEDRSLDQPIFPAIVEDEGGNLSVVLGVSKNHAILADPLQGLQKILRRDFLQSWSGKLLTVSYVPSFGDSGKTGFQVLKQFWPLILPYRSILLWIGAVSLLLQLLGSLEPLFAQIAIDKILTYKNYSLLFLMLTGIVLVAATRIASSALREILMAHALARISVTLSIQFFDRILSLSASTLAPWRVGDLLVRVQENERLLQLVSQSSFKIVVDSLTIIVYLVILLGQNAKLTGVALLFVMAYGLTLVISSPLLRANDRRVFKCHQEVESHLIETIQGIQTVKALATEKIFFQQGVKLINRLVVAQFKGALLGFNIGLIGGLINQLATISILGYGATLTINGILSPGQLIAFNIMLGLLLTPLQSLIGVWDELQEMRISFDRINDVLVLPIEHQDANAVMPAISGRVTFENVCFRYENSPQDILHHLNLEILPGQKIAVVGSSGAGKTTLAKLLGKLLQPTAGRILIDGIDITNIELSSYRQQLGVVEQQPFLFNGTIRENITKADPLASLETVMAVAKLAGAAEFIEKLPMDYDTQVGERGIMLSGGQKQRLAIARVLLTDPRILILDEPTAALDVESERIIQQNLDRQTASRTTFIFAHRLSTIRNADLILVLEQGEIVERGTHEQLLAEGNLYSSFYHTSSS